MAASLPRFGQRENEGAALSDSDYYLDMAEVFAGEAERFDARYSAPGHPGAHHYGRPLLPWLAAGLDPLLPGGARAAFSLLNLLAAWAAALALTFHLSQAVPGLRHPWVPGALFLTGFPQVNWGYHLLTDTFGLATALVACLCAAALLRWHARERPLPLDARVVGALAGLFALQALAFLTRETAWIGVVAVAGLVASGVLGRTPRRPSLDLRFGAAVVAVLLAAKLPHALYMARFGLEGVPFAFAPAVWLDPGYGLDFLLKSAVAFHLAWPLALLGLRRGGLARVPPVLVAWAGAGLLYMAAGYAHNSLAGIGYPLRLTWALFPLVYALAWRWLEDAAPGRRLLGAALLAVAVNLAVGVAGTRLDEGRSGVTVPGMLDRG
ncbi:MAG: hypothetical protein KY453_09745 [Gemmatimonadetes bacterium]|nr:hypothetical protein [Gemmatimonadota bacterium]